MTSDAWLAVCFAETSVALWDATADLGRSTGLPVSDELAEQLSDAMARSRLAGRHSVSWRRDPFGLLPLATPLSRHDRRLGGEDVLSAVGTAGCLRAR